jgi:hypothetical protein
MVATVTAAATVDWVTVETRIDIQASDAMVWSIVTDFQAYDEWHPQMTAVRGAPAAGSRLDFTARVGDDVRTLNARIDQVIAPTTMCWAGPVSIAARMVFRGRHCLIIEPAGGSQVRFVNRERFGGLLAPVLRRYLTRDVANAYGAANVALKTRAERRASMVGARPRSAPPTPRSALRPARPDEPL